MSEQNQTFDAIMESITRGFTGDSDHDRAYLIAQMESYKEHPLSTEIVRACSRLLFGMLPEDQREKLTQIMGSRRDATQATLDEVEFNVKMGRWTKALELMEPLVTKMDQLIEAGIGADDTESRYFDFQSPRDEFVWRAHNEEPRTLRPSPEPFSRVFFTYGSCLLEAKRYDEAIEACKKAIRWNPVNINYRYELGENYKKLNDMETYGEILRELYPYIATAADLARYHRSMGYLGIEQRTFELAAAHLMVSLLFEKSPLPLSEIMYIKQEFGADYTDMTPTEGFELLEAAGEAVLLDEDTFRALNQLITVSIQHEDYATTLQTVVELYRVTGGERYKKIAQDLMDAMGIEEGDE